MGAEVLAVLFLAGIMAMIFSEWRYRRRERTARRLAAAAVHYQQRRSELSSPTKRVEWVMLRMQRYHKHMPHDLLVEMVDAALLEAENEYQLANASRRTTIDGSSARRILRRELESRNRGT